MMQQMADADALREALDALQRAQMAIAMNKSWSDAKAANAAPVTTRLRQMQRPRLGHGGKPGSGVGTWPTKLAGLISRPSGGRR